MTKTAPKVPTKRTPKTKTNVEKYERPDNNTSIINILKTDTGFSIVRPIPKEVDDSYFLFSDAYLAALIIMDSKQRVKYSVNRFCSEVKKYLRQFEKEMEIK